MTSPLAGLRSAWLEFRNFKASGWLMFSICAIALIPLIYAGLFLLAFLDPYGNLANVPAAVVNLDQGAELDGEERNLGQELCDSLIENNEERDEGQATGYNWQFTTREAADSGLRDATYYMELIIPENFTESVASADSKNPESAELQVYFNPSTNLIAQTVGSSMVTKIKAELNGKIQESYFDTIFVSLDDAADSLQDAVDGSKELADGLDDAVDGTNKLSDGVGQLEDGSATLTDGLNTASKGSSDLSDGIKDAKDGSSKITSGLKEAKDGSKSLSSGAASAKEGSKQLSDGASALSDGTSSLSEGASNLSAGVTTLGDNVEQLDAGIKAAQASTADLATALTGLANALQAYSATGDASYLATANQIAAGISQSAPTIGTDLNTYMSDLSSALSAYQSAAASSASAKSKMEAATEKVQSIAGGFQSDLSETGAALSDFGTKGQSYQSLAAKAQELAAQAQSAAAEAQEYAAKAQEAAEAGDTESAAEWTAKAQDASANAQDLAAQAQEKSEEATAAAGETLSSASVLATAVKAIVSGSDSGSGVKLLMALESLNSASAEYQDAATKEAQAAAAASEAKGVVTGYLKGIQNTSAMAAESTNTVAGAVSQLLSAIQGDLSTGAQSLAAGAKKVDSGAQSLAAGASSLDEGMASLSAGAKSLNEGIIALYDGSGTLTLGLGSAYTGSKSLAKGVKSAAEGSEKITDNLGTVGDGLDTLGDGLVTAADGASELNDGLADGQKELADSASNKDAKSEMMSEPVKANGEYGTGENITTVSNYGTGFAPYFIGLGMWVGCLMITFLIRSLNNRLLMSRASSFSAVFSSYVPMVAIAWIQVMILLAFIQFGLGFNVNFVPQYYLFGLLVACCFVAICQFFRAAMGTSGMVAIVILLMLQLCTAAGTFPIEAEIPIFNILNPLLPMTYVVQGFRMAMCGLSAGLMVKSAIVLAGFTLAFLFLSTVVANRKRRVSMNTMYPKIQMVH